MNRITATWWNGCLKKLIDHPLHTIPKQQPYQNGCSHKNVCSNNPCFIQVRSPSSDNLCLLFCLYPSFMVGPLRLQWRLCTVWKKCTKLIKNAIENFHNISILILINIYFQFIFDLFLSDIVENRQLKLKLIVPPICRLCIEVMNYPQMVTGTHWQWSIKIYKLITSCQLQYLSYQCPYKE